MPKPKSAPYLALKTDFRKDERFEVLGQIAGFNKYEALGRMTHLWAWCRDRKLEDAPADSDGYVVAEAIVLRFLGPHGVDAILAKDVSSEFALGIRRADGIYLRGTSETVKALRSSKYGGNIRAGAPREGGRFVQAGETPVPTGGGPVVDKVPSPGETTSCSPAIDQLSTSGSPAIDQRFTSGSPAGGGENTSGSPAPPTSDLRPPLKEGASPSAPAFSLSLAPPESEPTPRRSKPATDPHEQSEHQRAVARFHELYLEHYEAKLDWKSGGQAKNFAELVKSHGASEVIRRADLLFAGGGPAWVKPPFTPNTLHSQWNHLIANVANQPHVTRKIQKL